MKREAIIERFKTTIRDDKPTLRFPIGTKIGFTTAGFSEWCAGTVLDHHCEDEGETYAYVVETYNGRATYFIPHDHDGLISDYPTLTSRGRHLRFCIGDRVRCHLERMWCSGTIVQTWWLDDDGAFFPYQICLDDTRNLIFCPCDCDDSIQSLQKVAERADSMEKELLQEEDKKTAKRTKKTQKKQRQRERRRRQSVGNTASNASEESTASEKKHTDGDGADDDPPDELRCPITLQLFDDPVIAADGHAYERRAMHDWLARSNQSPRTGAALPHSLLTPCHHLRVAADEWRESH